MRGHRLLIAALVLALVQIGFLTWIIMARAAVLRDGREVILKVEPVDPRDLLRGDYVRLGFDIGRIPVELIRNVPAGTFGTQDGSIHVRVSKGDDGYWHAVSATLDAPSGVEPGPDEAEMRGTVHGGRSLAPGTSIDVEYGLERFYLPEGEGIAIENDMRVRPFAIKVAVAEDGTSQIKALLDGDKTLFEEPLY